VKDPAQGVSGHKRELRISFVDEIAAGQVALMTFRDPAPCYAILTEATPIATREPAATDHGDTLDIVLIPTPSAPQTSPPAITESSREKPTTPPVFIKYRGVELTLRSGLATLQCDPDQADSLISALVEFAHYERHLRRIEAEIAQGWPDLDQDKGLAFEVTPADLDRRAIVGERVNRTFSQRIHLARIEPHLNQPADTLPAAAHKLGAELREKSQIEARFETVDGQLEVFEYIYELSSQRIGEYKAAREEHTLEWIIIVLLAVESLMILAQLLWKSRP